MSLSKTEWPKCRIGKLLPVVLQQTKNKKKTATDRQERTMIYLAGVPLIDAVRMMTLTPARILHIDKEKGSLEIGKDADIVIFDNQININNTILKGHVIYTK